MVQRLQPAGTLPTEHSPLINETGRPNLGPLASSEPNINGNGKSITNVAIKRVNDSDEESVASGEVETQIGRGQVVRIISVLLIGIFVAHTDGSILLATHSNIASEFNALSDSTWLITSFALAGAATQTIYGKLSDIYGRRTLVLVAYSIFVVGCAIVGLGQTYWQVILGRVVSGAGASGMAGLVSILIADLLPIREVAQWRAYVNLVATFGRSIGGPLGGWLVDVIGWRWSFFGQVPIILVAILLVIAYLPNITSKDSSSATSAQTDSLGLKKSKLSRIDFKGSFLFALMILSLMTATELGGEKYPWSHPLIISMFALGIILIFVFVKVEQEQEEPILPLEIFHQRDAVFSYIIISLQTAAQLGLMFSVPLYFRITQGASNTVSGAHLVPAVVGNAIGGVLSGVIIKRSGRYKALTVFAVTASSFSYLLLLFRWHGNTNFWESLYIFPGGFGTGVAQSAVFISLQAVVDVAHMAPAVSFMYLSTTIASTAGLCISGAVEGAAVRYILHNKLVDLGFGAEKIRQIILDAISDVDFVDHISEPIKEAVVSSYVYALWWTHIVSFLFSFSAFVLALFIRQRRLAGLVSS